MTKSELHQQQQLLPQSSNADDEDDAAEFTFGMTVPDRPPVAPPANVVVPLPRRSNRVRQAPNFLGDYVTP